MIISLDNVLSALGLVLTGASMLAAVWWVLQRQITEQAEEFAAYKLEVAEKYAQVGHLKEVEARLAVSIDRLTDRIDKLLDQLAKAPARRTHS